VGDQVVTVLAALVEWVAHVALAAVQVLSWFGLGSLVLYRLRTGHVAVDALNRVGAGAVAFALLTLAAGLAGLLYAELFIPVTVVAAVGGALVALRAARGLRLPTLRDLPRWQSGLALALAATLAMAIVATGAPVNGYDAQTYHVSVPVLYEAHHEVFETEWNWSSYQPFNVEMLITDGLLLWDPIQGAFAVLALVAGAAVAVVVGGWMIGGSAVGLLAGAIFFTQPLVAWEATAALVDGGIAFAVALAGLNVLVAVQQRRPELFLVAGAFAGAGAGMKYFGLFAALATALVVLLSAERGRRTVSLVAFGVPAVLIALPWYLKNWIFTGNPLFPFVFGGASESARAAIDAALSYHGFGHSPLDALLLPVRLMTHSDAFDGSGWLSPLVLVAPLALLDKRVRRGAAVALAGCAVYGAFWFYTSQQARFLIPMFPVLSVLAALGLRAVAIRRVGRALAPAATALAIGAGLTVFAVYCAQFVPVVVGLETKEDFLSERTGYYDGVAWLNRELGESDGVLIDFASPYLEQPYVVWTSLLIPPEASAEEVRRLVRKKRLRYAAILAIYRDSRRHHLAAMRARRVATIDVHTAYLGLRRWGGIRHRLLVYRLPDNGPG
jgi:hypothetical protein